MIKPSIKVPNENESVSEEESITDPEWGILYYFKMYI